MPSIRHNSGDDALLDAARACLLDVGWRRTTLTDVARRAGVSRMTIYRRWPDMQTLLADLMTREWSGVAAEATPDGANALERIADGVARTSTALRENPLFRKIVSVDPELLLPYLLDRRGRSQDAILSLIEAAIRDGQREGSVRAGDPVLLARSLLLAAHGHTISAQTMTDPVTAEQLAAELRTMAARYLAR